MIVDQTILDLYPCFDTDIFVKLNKHTRYFNATLAH